MVLIDALWPLVHEGAKSPEDGLEVHVANDKSSEQKSMLKTIATWHGTVVLTYGRHAKYMIL